MLTTDPMILEAKIDKIREENPDLDYDLIKSILIAQQEIKSNKLEPYDFD